MSSSLLWQIEKLSTKPSYLYGTIHLKSHLVFRNIDSIKPFLTSVDQLALEYDFSEVTDRLIQGSSLMDCSLINIIGKKSYFKIHKQCLKSFDIDLDQYQFLKPLFLHSILIDKIFPSTNVYNMDQSLYAVFNNMKKSTIGLESFEDQLEIASNIKIDFQIKELKKIFRNPKKFKRKVSRLMQLYLDQNIHELYKVSKKGLGKYKNTMLYNRNFKIAHRISSILEEPKSTFIAVGAGHLSGKYGLISILKSKGIKLTAINIYKPQ